MTATTTASELKHLAIARAQALGVDAIVRTVAYAGESDGYRINFTIPAKSNAALADEESHRYGRLMALEYKHAY